MSSVVPRLVILSAIAAAGLVSLAGTLGAFGGTRVPPLVVSRATTFITAPLLPDGTPDYAAFLNARRASDVTGDKIAAAEPWSGKLVGTSVDSAPLASALRGDFEPWPADFDEAYRKQMARSRIAPWRAADAPVAAAWLRVNEAELRQIDGVVAAGVRRWEPGLSDLKFDSAVPSLMPLRDIANAYHTRSMAAMGRGDEDGAIRTTALALRYAAMFDRGSLLDRLMGISAREIGVEAAVVLANPPPLRVATAEQLLVALKALPATPPLEDVIEVDERLLAWRAGPTSTARRVSPRRYSSSGSRKLPASVKGWRRAWAWPLRRPICAVSPPQQWTGMSCFAVSTPAGAVTPAHPTWRRRRRTSARAGSSACGRRRYSLVMPGGGWPTLCSRCSHRVHPSIRTARGTSSRRRRAWRWSARLPRSRISPPGDILLIRRP
jgi:hypothetical protein